MKKTIPRILSSLDIGSIGPTYPSWGEISWFPSNTWRSILELISRDDADMLFEILKIQSLLFERLLPTLDKTQNYAAMWGWWDHDG